MLLGILSLVYFLIYCLVITAVLQSSLRCTFLLRLRGKEWLPLDLLQRTIAVGIICITLALRHLPGQTYFSCHVTDAIFCLVQLAFFGVTVIRAAWTAIMLDPPLREICLPFVRRNAHPIRAIKFCLAFCLVLSFAFTLRVRRLCESM